MNDRDIEQAVRDVIEKATNNPGFHSIDSDDGRQQIYAYRQDDSVHYGFNGGKYGFCVWQGVWFGKDDPRNTRWNTGNPGTMD